MSRLPGEVNADAATSGPAGGLLSANKGAPDSTSAATAPDDGSPRQASVEEQEQYDLFVYQSYNLFYGSPEMAAMVVDMLRGGGEDGDPIEGLAKASSTVIIRVIQSADEAGVELGDDVIWAAGTEVFGELADLAKDAGIKDFDADPDALEGAYFRACDYVRVALQQSGRVVQENAKADLARLEDMDAKGDLKSVLMKMAEVSDRIPAEGAGQDGGEMTGNAAPPQREQPIPKEEPAPPSKPARGLMPKEAR